MNRLRELRKKRGLTLVELAEKIHINKSSIARFETEQSVMDTKDLELFCNFYNVTTDYLLGITNNPNAVKLNVADADGTTMQLEYELLNKMNGFTVQDFQKVSEYIDFLKMICYNGLTKANTQRKKKRGQKNGKTQHKIGCLLHRKNDRI